jgi:hypothetical protein
MTTEDEFRAQVLADLKAIRATVDGIPVINRSITVMRQEIRMLRATFNDFARTSKSGGGHD